MLIPPDVPSPAGLEAELEALVHRHGQPTLAPDSRLLRLAVVAHRAGSDLGRAREAALIELMPQISARLGTTPRAQAATNLLGLSGALRSSSIGPRRRAAAAAFTIEPDSFRRRHERPLIADLAHAIVEAEVAFQHRSREIDPSRIDWPGRFAAYGRIYTSLGAVGNDLEVLVRVQREKPDEFDYLIGQLGSSLWFFSHLLVAIDEFVDDYGGIWLLGDADAETRAAKTVMHALRHPALHEHDRSWLRITLRETADRELDPFLETVADGVRGRTILQAWVEWCQSCQCRNLKTPASTCEVHDLIASADAYQQLLDYELRHLGEPVRAHLRGIAADHIKAMIDRFGAVIDP